jgi:type II secretory ATPase GspE/PulE/Tfp pilus assembly ATPase PilB-like protein
MSAEGAAVSDLSNPPSSLWPSDGLAFPAAFAWPTPNLPGYPSATPIDTAPACEIEGLNGRAIEGRLSLFDPALGLVHVRVNEARKPLSLRLDQFRRMRLVEPLQAAEPKDARDLAAERPRLPFTIAFKGATAWQGVTLAHCEESYGLFLFEPAPDSGNGADSGAVRRWFVPRAAYDHAEVGVLLGQALVNQHSVTPDQLQAALSEQEMLRGRKLGDIMVVRQLIKPEDLSAALQHQARMPMVRIGEALTALGYITEVQLEDALKQQRSDRGVPLGELLVRKGVVSREHLQTALARKMGYPMVDVLQFPADADAVARLPYAIATRVQALPLMVRAGRLVVAVEDPGDRKRIDEVEFAAQCKVVPVLAVAGTLTSAIDRAYEKVGATDFAWRSAEAGSTPIEFEAPDTSKLLATIEEAELPLDALGDDAIAQSDNTLVRLINSMIVEAHTQGVSDIHIECPAGREKVRIRFRKDGLLRPYLELPGSYRSAMVSRLKVMCELDISEHRKPQDGKINFAKFVQGMKLELRVATIPTHSNLEDAVIRLLATNKPIPLDNLGLSPGNLARLKLAAARPYGMILCVGPTGSGKTTTLHSVLSAINLPERKIWTAEDPIEITQAGLRQVQVNPRIDWTFAKALRAFLRADPDVIMVGEIRDSETGQVAIEASLTGHLVLSTLHTNSAPETVTRLLDMGMDPFNFADALQCVLAQRLVRRLCTACRTARDASPEEEEELLRDYLHVLQGVENAPGDEEVLGDWRRRFGGPVSAGADSGRLTLYRPVGCDHCNNTGYRGRAGIHELMTVSRSLRHLIQTGQRSDDLQRHALSDGMRTLRQDGIEKVLAGVTTIEEVRASS